MEFSKVVNLRLINPEKLKIEMVHGSQNSYTVWLELDSAPDNVWSGIFYDELGKSIRIGEAMINEACITVLTSPEDFKRKIDLIRKVVDYTNQQVDQHNKKVEQEREVQRRREAKGEEDIKKMREQLKQ